MKRIKMLQLIMLILISPFLLSFYADKNVPDKDEHKFNSYYSGKNLDQIAFPIGGIGAGMFCLEGTGAISHVSVNNKPEMYNEPFAFAAISIKGLVNGAKLLEAQVPTWKLFGPGGAGNGSPGKSYGLPRFESGRFLARFPFASIELEDKDIPLKVEILGWSPFIPTDEDNSSLPAGALEYTFTNNSPKDIDAVFSWNSRNFIAEGTGFIVKTRNGFTLTTKDAAVFPKNSGFSFFVDDDNAVIDYCWFRGQWFDPHMILWKNIKQCNMPANPPLDGVAAGASIFVPVKLKPGEKKTVKLNFCWYMPDSKLAIGKAQITGPAFGKKPSIANVQGQQKVTGFAGNQLVNSFDPAGDGQMGVLQSAVFKINKNYLSFLIGGGASANTSVNLLINGKIVEHASGENSEMLKQKTWDVKQFLGKEAIIQIVDSATGAWGHIMADEFLLSDNQNENLLSPTSKAVILADFETSDFGNWSVGGTEAGKKECCPGGECTPDPFYKPWYASRFKNLDELIKYWTLQSADLKKNSELFRDAFYSSSLPPEVIEAIAANLTILKSPTVLRQFDGRLWAWEGCGDNEGCCHGSCTHVWNYAQAVPHLFPALERTLRETEFKLSQNAEGHQTFRANIPLSISAHDFYAAADGQLGGIMKVYREWRISGNTDWMKNMYPNVKKSLDYCIATWDPKQKGTIEEPHHNTYDIEFWGPDGMCNSFYLGALTAIIEMSKVADKPYDNYESLLKKGKAFIETELYNGEYFIQKVVWEGLKAASPVDVASKGIMTNYSKDALDLLKIEGPKYQYGIGCLSDGILGMWLASSCGLDEVISTDKVKSHLLSVYKYNLKSTLIDHVNPQRPTYACGNEGGLLLCTWPKGGELSLPFVYSNEVWTGIEYQVASHLMMKNEVAKGLEIVRTCRNRYDGSVRNPFDEYECGHWYARAMSSYALLEGLTGVRFDAVTGTLFIDSKVGDFTSFLSTETGFGNVSFINGKTEVNAVFGSIPVKKLVVSGTEKPWKLVNRK